jgi:hypothetical protein
VVLGKKSGGRASLEGWKRQRARAREQDMRAEIARIVARIVVAIGALFIAGACGAGSPWVRELPASSRASLANAPALYAPESTSVAQTDETRALRAVFEAAFPRELAGLLRNEPALDLVAAVAAEAYRDGYERPARSLMNWLFWRSGATSLYSHMSASHGRTIIHRAALDAYAAESARKAAGRGATPMTYGVARFTLGRVTSQVIVYGRAPLHVLPFQKTYSPGAPLTLKVRPMDHSTGFVFYAETDTREVVEEALERREDGSYFVSRAVPTRPGRYFIEVRARQPKNTVARGERPWRRPLLLVPIYVGVPEPQVPDDFITHPPPVPDNPSMWAAWIAGRYNAERQRAGKPPLEVDLKLTLMAEERSRYAAVHDDEAPPTPELAARLSERRHLESTATFDSVSDHVHLRLLEPSTRRTIVLTDRASIGIGVAPGIPDERGRVRYTAVEYLVFP